MDKTTLTDFYAKKNVPDSGYAGGVYDVARLLNLRPVRTWMGARRDRRVSVADVGCGRGAFLADLLARMQARHAVGCARAIGIDFVHYEPNQFGRIPPEVFQFASADLDGGQLPLDDNSMDIMACNHVLEHVFHTERLAREMTRVLRVGGLAVISVPNLAAWVNRCWLLFGCQPLATEIGSERVDHGMRPGWVKDRLESLRPAGHIRAFTPRGLSDLCCRSGLVPLGWWNQDERRVFRLTAWSGRNVGLIATKAAAGTSI